MFFFGPINPMRRVLLSLTLFTFAITLCPHAFGAPTVVVVEAGDRESIDLRKWRQKTDPEFSVLKNEGPAWVTVDGSDLEIKPPKEIAGDFAVKVTLTSKPKEMPPPSESDAKNTVKPKPETDIPPTVVQLTVRAFSNPVVKDEVALGEMEERGKFKKNISSVVSHPAPKSLRFKLAQPSNWATLSEDGTVEAAPTREQVGSFSLKVIVSSEFGGQEKFSLQGTVKKVPIAPKWTAASYDLPETTEEKPYEFQIPPEWIVHPEKTRLRFIKTASKQPWVELSEKGRVSGTVLRPATGPQQMTVQLETEIDDKPYTASTTFKWIARNINKTPVVPSEPTTLTAAKSNKSYSNMAWKSSISDPDGDPLTYQILPGGGPAFVSMLPTGEIRAEPRTQHTGRHRIAYTVTDGKLTSKGNLELEVTNSPPKWKEPTLTLPQATEDSQYSFDLQTKIDDPDQDALEYRLKSPPPWLRLQGTKVEGRPERPHVGTHNIEIEAKDPIHPPVPVPATIVVKRINKAPSFISQVFDLGKLPERQSLERDLLPDSTDPDPNPTLKFKLQDPSTWVEIRTNKLVLKPGRPDLGMKEFKVVVEDEGGLKGTALYRLAVLKDNRAPEWKALTLPEAVEDRAYHFDLKSVVSDLDHDKLKFQCSGLPTWLLQSPEGTLSGTPARQDARETEIKCTVFDDDTSVATKSSLKTILKPYPPTIHKENWTAALKERTALEFDLSTKEYSEDPNKDALTFQWEGPAPTWAKLESNGKLKISPNHPQVGNHSLQLAVSDGRHTVKTPFTVSVQRDARSPVWTAETYSLKQLSRETLEKDLIPWAKDLDGEKLTFTKRSGPEWLTITPEGKLTAKPTDYQAGDYRLNIEAKNDVLAARTEIDLHVELKNKPPHWNQAQLTLPLATEDSEFSFDLKTLTKDPDDDTLDYRAENLPPWLKLKGSVLSGTPRRENTIRSTFTVFARDPFFPAVSSTLTIEAKRINKPPFFTKNIFELGSHPERQGFQVDLMPFIGDPDENQKFTLRLKTPVNWIQISKSGEFQAKPERPNVGRHDLTIIVEDQGGLKAESTLGFVVTKDNRAPVWKSSIAQWPDGMERQPYKLDLKEYVSDEDRDPLRFELKGAPRWIQLSPDGHVTGTPLHEHVSTEKFEVIVFDEDTSVKTRSSLKIELKPYPPEIRAAALNFTIKERTKRTIQLKDSQYVYDPNEDSLQFKWENDPGDWASLSRDGELMLSPVLKNVGSKLLPFTVSDGKHTVRGQITLDVQRDPRPPTWTVEKLHFKTSAREPFTASIASKVSDPDGLKYTLSKESGPKWLTVDAEGNLKGTPPDSGVGLVSARIEADNGLRQSIKDVTLEVLFKNHPPETNPKLLTLDLEERTTPTVNLVLSGAVMDQDVTNKLRFSPKRTPDWMEFEKDGRIQMKLGFKEIGTHKVAFEVSDGDDSITSELTINVRRVPRAPQWKTPQVKFKLLSRDTFTKDLGTIVSDLDGQKISFKKLSGSEWVKVSPEGVLTATPEDADVGEGHLRVETSNDVQSSRMDIELYVEFKNNPPHWTEKSFKLTRGFANAVYAHPLRDFAVEKDPDQTLTFQKVSGPGWAFVDPSGQIFGKPTRADLGRNTFEIAVQDSMGGTAEAEFTFEIDDENKPPVIKQSVVNLPHAYPGELFLQNLSQYVSDASGDKLSFRKVSGPKWLLIQRTGELNGVPEMGDAGEFKAVFEVSDGYLSSTMKVQGQVNAPEVAKMPTLAPGQALPSFDFPLGKPANTGNRAPAANRAPAKAAPTVKGKRR